MLRISTLILLIGLTFNSLELFAQSPTPAPPGTGARSVQMFQGKSQNVWVAVYPPTTYADGTPIKSGTPVKIRVYRSYDGGKSYTSRVTVLSGGSGYVGQGKAGSRRKPWIDLKLKVPVDNKSPYLVVLGVTAVVGKEESPVNVSNLTFRYFPSLQIFGTPAEAFGEKDSGKGRSRGPLHGTWNLDGQGTLVIHENRNRVQGSIHVQGQKVATLSGSRKGNRYSLAVTLTLEGKQYDATVSLNVAQDGKSVQGTATANGESIPLKFKLNGRRITAA